jgi:hypothetical protein
MNQKNQLFTQALIVSLIMMASTAVFSRSVKKDAIMPQKIYDAYSTLNSAQPPVKLGQVSITQGKLAIDSLLDESRRKEVQASLDEFNNRKFLVQKSPPKNSTEKFGMDAVEFKRGTEDFDRILVRQLEGARQIRLEPVR